MVEAASVPYATLGNTLTNSFKGIADAIDGYQKLKTELNTQHYLDQLDAYADPNKLEAARQNGAIEALRNSYGRYFDRKATRGSDEARLNSLQEVEKGHQQYTDMITRAAQRGLVNQAQQMIMNGVSADKVNDFINKNNLLESEDLRKFQMDWAKHTSGLALDKARIAYSNFQLNEAMAKAREEAQRKEMIRARNQLGNRIAQQESEGNIAVSRLIESNPEIESVLKKNASGEGYDFIGSILDLGRMASTKPITEVSLGDKTIAELTSKAKDNVDSRYPRQYIPKYKQDRGEVSSSVIADPRVLATEYETEKNRLIQEEKDRQIAEQNAQIKANADKANNTLALLNKYAGENDLYTKLKDHSDEVRALRDSYVNNGADPEVAYEVFNPSATSPFTLPSYGSAYNNKAAEDKAQKYFDNKAIKGNVIGATNNLTIDEQHERIQDKLFKLYEDKDDARAAYTATKQFLEEGLKLPSGKYIKVPFGVLDNVLDEVKFAGFFNNAENFKDGIKNRIIDILRKHSEYVEQWEQQSRDADMASLRNWGTKK